MKRPLWLVPTGLAVLASMTGVVAGIDEAPAAAPAPAHGAFVPENPATIFPRITNGQVKAGDRVAQFVVLGGSFTSMTLQNGSTATQPYVASFDIDSGVLSSTFHPVLDGTVSVIEAGDTPGTLFIGGLFRNVNGAIATRLAKLDVLTGQLVPGFSASVDGEVTTLARFGDRLFVGGEFGNVNSQPRARLAEISAKTGKLSAAFAVGVTGKRDSGCRADGFCYTMGGAVMRSIRLTPDGRRLVVMHRGDQVGGLTRWGVAVIDVSGTSPVVTPFRADLWDPSRNNSRTEFVGIIEGDMSPDGSMVAFSNGIGNFPPLHDSVIAFPTSGGEATQPLWVTQNFDSTYGLTVSDQAVYMGGHFCWTESQASTASPLYWPGNIGNQYSCALTGGGVFQPQTTYRFHVGAVDLPSGRALAWNPGSNNSSEGVKFLRTIDRGLLLGHDGTLVRGLTVGRSALFDFGISREPRELAIPTATITSPVNGSTANIQTVSGTAIDDYRLKRVRVRVKDVVSGLWVQADGSLGSTAYLWDATLGAEGLPGTTRNWTVTGLPAAVGALQIQARAIDLAIKNSAWVTVNVTGSPAALLPAAAAVPVAAVPGVVDTTGAGPTTAATTGAVVDAADVAASDPPVADPVTVDAGPTAIDANPRPVAVPDPRPGDDEAKLLPWRLDVTQATGLSVASDGTVARVGKDGKVRRRDRAGKWIEHARAKGGFEGPIALASGDRFVGGKHDGTWEWDGKKLNKVFGFEPTSLAVSDDGTIAAIDAATGAVAIRENGAVVVDEPARWLAVEKAGSYGKVGLDGNVYRGRPGAWTQVGGQAKSIAVSSTGRLAAVLADGSVATLAPDGSWKDLGQLPVAAAQVSIQDAAVYVLGVDLNVYRLA